MVTHTGNHLDRTIRQHIDLLNLTVPERIVEQQHAKLLQGSLRIFPFDVASSHNQVRRVVLAGNDGAKVVNIVALTVIGHDTHDGNTLGEINEYTSRLRLIALDMLDQRAFQKCFLYLARTHITHAVAHWIDLSMLELHLHLVDIEETIAGTVGDVDLHLTANGILVIRTIECCDG